MNRLLLVGAIIGLSVVGCNKGPDSVGRGADTSAAADASPGTMVPPPPSPAVSLGSQVSTGGDSAATAMDSDSVVANSDVTGAYMILGSVPVEFAEIEHLGLATIDERGEPAPLNGFIRPKMSSAKDYKLIKPKLVGRALTFTTTTEGGISYTFTGAFTRLGNFPANPPAADTPVLKGTLTRLRNGNIVAMTSISFAYSAGG